MLFMNNCSLVGKTDLLITTYKVPIGNIVPVTVEA